MIFVLYITMRYLGVYFVFFFTYQVFSQDFSAEFIKMQPLNIETFIGADKFSNIFYTNNRTLYKKEKNKILEYAALNLGEITSVDIVNPLKISVFYKMSNTVVFLDNTLTEITRVDFSTLEDFKNTTIVATANDRRVWVFNTDLQQLEIFDYRLDKTVVEFPPTSTIPKVYTSNFNFCWLQQINSLSTYNTYGTLVEEISIPATFESLTQSQSTLIGLRENHLYIKKAKSNSFKLIDNLKITAKEFSLIGEILYIYDGQHLLTYSIKLAK